MKTINPSSDDQGRLESLILAYDAALVDGSGLREEADSTLPEPLAEKLSGVQSALRLLKQARLEGLTGDSFPAESPAVHNATDREPFDMRALVVDATSLSIEGQLVGRFELLRELGRGGYGVVFLANDPQLGRQVALKIPRPEVLMGQDTRRRFLREAQAAGGLEHPNLIPMYEVGQDGPFCFLASAYCDGPTLSQWFKDRATAVPLHEAARLICALANGVEHAHKRGVLHRDIKPSNVLLDKPRQSSLAHVSDPIPRLTDFGLAKLVELADDETRSGALLGTPAYMAPEQAEGRLRDIGPWTDIYALGAMLYELVCGRPPFRGESDVQTLQDVVRGEVPGMARLRPGVSRDLEAITLKCLERVPANRYGSADKLADDLERFLNGEPTWARPTGAVERLAKWTRRRPALAALLGVVAAAVVGLFGVVIAYNARLGKEVVRAEREVEVSRKLLYSADVRVAYETLRANNIVQTLEVLNRQIPVQGQEDLREFAWYYLREQCEPPSLNLTGHGSGVMSVSFSPDGKLLASGGADGTARLWDAVTGNPLRVLRDNTKEVTCTTFAPNGRLLATGYENHLIRLWDPATGEAGRMLTGHEDQVLAIGFSPDSGLLASGGCDETVRIWDVTTGATIQELEGEMDVVHAVTFSPNGDLLFAVDEAGRLHVWRTDNWERLAREAIPKEKYFALAISRSGNRIAAAGRREVIDVWDSANGELKRSAELQGGHTEWIQSLAFSPVDDTLASAGKDRVLRLWKRGAAAPFRTLLGHEDRIWSVAWSPDGQRLASAGADGVVKIWPSSDDGAKFYPLVPSTTTICKLSGDGTLLATPAEDGMLRIWNVAARSVINAFPLHHDKILCLQFSPDCSLIATRGEDGTMRVRRCDSSRQILARNAPPGTSSAMAFHPDGRQLATAVDERTVALFDVAFNRIIRRFPHETAVRSIEFTPDGRYLVTTSQSLEVRDVTTGRIIYALTQPHDDLVVARDGRLIAAATGSNVTLLDLESDRQVSTLVTGGADVKSLAMSPDGNTLAAALTQPEVISFWDTRTRQLLMQVEWDAHSVVEIEFSADGRRLLATGALPDRQRAVWEWTIHAKPRILATE